MMTKQIRYCVLLLSVTWSALLTGCSGQATISAVPFMRTDFAPTEQAVETIAANEAYYWLDDDGMLNIALRRYVPSVWDSAFDEIWVMSLKLEGLPAGSERLYRLGSQSVRQASSHGGLHYRSASLMGVAVAEAPCDGRLEGRLHAVVRRQQFSVLTGWTPDIFRAPMVVMTGTFEAVHNSATGREIRERATADGFGRIEVRRRRRITSRPSVTSRPAVTTRPR